MFKRLLSLISEESEKDSHLVAELAAAALMFEVVWADHEATAAELESMSNLLERQFQIPRETSAQVIAITREDFHNSVGVFEDTRTLNQELSQTQKAQVIAALWTLAYADKTIDALEEATIRKIADLLYVPHASFIQAKIAARQAADT